MNCKNCIHWVFGRCTVSNFIVGPGQLCNAWELSQSHEMVTMPFATFDDKELQERIAELEVENERLQDAWFRDETICPDGSLRPKVSDLLKRVTELEAENAMLKQPLQPVELWSDEKKQTYKDNECRSEKSGKEVQE